MLTNEQREALKELVSLVSNMHPTKWAVACSAINGILAASAAPVKIVPQGVMGIPPNPPGSASFTVSPGLTWNASAAPAEGREENTESEECTKQSRNLSGLRNVPAIRVIGSAPAKSRSTSTAHVSCTDSTEIHTDSDGGCQERDGCPTEKAVLQRFWRAHKGNVPSHLALATAPTMSEAAWDFIQECAALGGKMVNGNRLSAKAASILAEIDRAAAKGGDDA